MFRRLNHTAFHDPSTVEPEMNAFEGSGPINVRRSNVPVPTDSRRSQGDSSPGKMLRGAMLPAPYLFPHFTYRGMPLQ